jgi:hypothetical protein
MRYLQIGAVRKFFLYSATFIKIVQGLTPPIWLMGSTGNLGLCVETLVAWRGRLMTWDLTPGSQRYIYISSSWNFEPNFVRGLQPTALILFVILINDQNICTRKLDCSWNHRRVIMQITCNTPATGTNLGIVIFSKHVLVDSNERRRHSEFQRALLPRALSRVPVNNYFLHVIQTGCEDHPTFYPIGVRDSFHGVKSVGSWSWPLNSI